MARTGTVKLSIVSAFDDKGAKAAERALEKFQKRFDLAADSQAMTLARQSAALDKHAADLEKKYARIGGAIESVGGGMSAAGDAMTRGFTIPVMAAGAAMFNAATDFESAFAGVEKTVDGTAEQMAALKQGIRDMAMELPSSRESIAAVAAAAGQLGIETENVLGFTRVMIDLGESTDLAATDGAIALARFANITQMSQKDFDRLGSSVVALGNNMATTESDVVNMGLRIAGAGKQVGMTEPQIMALSAALSSVGIEAEAGGSAISKTMINIAASVATGSDDLKLWADTAGMSAKEFTDAWKRDPALALNSVITGLADLEEQGGSTLVQLEKLGITEVRQRDALLRAAGAGDILTKAIKLSTEAWDENTALADEAAKRYATTASQLGIMRNQVSDVALEFGESLAPAVMEALDAARPLLEWTKEQAEAFSALAPEQQEQIIKWVAIAAAAGPVLSVTGRLVSVVGGAVKAYGAIVGALGRWHAKMVAGKAVAAAEATGLDNVGKAAGRTTAAYGALTAASKLAGLALATAAWEKLAPAAEKYAQAVREGTEETLTAGQAIAKPISSLAYAWDMAKAEAQKYNKTGETTFKWTDAIAKPISSLMYGIALLGDSTDDYADATDDANDAARDYAQSLKDQTAATYAAIDAQLDAENADIALERAKLRLTDAQNALSTAIKEHGPNSREAKDATLDLRQAEVDLETAQRRAGDAQLALNTAMSQVPRPSSTDMQKWVDYYQAIGDKAGYAAAKANAANTALKRGYAQSSTGGRNIPVYGAGGHVTSPHLALVGDQDEWIINPRHPNAMSLLNGLIADMGVNLGRSFGSSATSRRVDVNLSIIAPGADASTVAGLRSAGGDLLAALTRELSLA